MVPGMNEKAKQAAEKYCKPALAGTDAHHPSEVGRAYAEFEGITTLDKHAMLTAKRKIVGRIASPLVKLFTRYAVLRNRLSGRKKRVD